MHIYNNDVFYHRDYALEKTALEDNMLLKAKMTDRNYHFKQIDKHLSKPITIKARHFNF